MSEKFDLSYAKAIVEGVDEAYRSGNVSEVFQRTPLSDACHDEIIMRCFEDIDFVEGPTMSARIFLANFDFVKTQFVSTYKLMNTDLAKAKVVHFGNMTPYSIANRAVDLAEEIEKKRDSKEKTEEWRNIARVTQIASQIYLNKLAIKK